MDYQNNFEPPTIEEIREFIDMHGLDVDPVQFYYYYAARGWYMNAGVMMCDWRSAVCCWQIQSQRF